MIIALSLFLSFAPTSQLANKAERYEGSYFKKGITARCADFVGTVVKECGKNPPSGYQKCTSWLAWGKKVTISKIKKGDIVIYEKKDGYNHIGIYKGSGVVIHRPTKSKPVGTISLHYRKIIGIRRL